MKNILITLILSLFLTGCSSIANWSIVYTPDIQQGNIITPEMVGELKPGMSKRQVRYILGSPLLVDVFHQERWDYPFTMKKRNEPIEIKRFSVYFTGDELARYEGNINPAPAAEVSEAKQEIVVSVPDYEGDKGVVEQGLNLIGVDLDD